MAVEVGSGEEFDGDDVVEVGEVDLPPRLQLGCGIKLTSPPRHQLGCGAHARRAAGQVQTSVNRQTRVQLVVRRRLRRLLVGHHALCSVSEQHTDSQLLCPAVGGIERYRDPSVRPSVCPNARPRSCPRLQLQLSHAWTADSSADGRRSAASRTAIGGGHIVSPLRGDNLFCSPVTKHKYRRAETTENIAQTSLLILRPALDLLLHNESTRNANGSV